MTQKIVIVILFLIAALVLIGFLQKGYPVTITEEELNTHLTKAFVYPDSPGYNPLVSAKLALYEGKGVLEAQWKQGQALTAEIYVTADGKDLAIKNLHVTGALLTGLFEQTSYHVLNSIVNTFIASQGQKKLERIGIKPGQLILHYRIGL